MIITVYIIRYCSISDCFRACCPWKRRVRAIDGSIETIDQALRSINTQANIANEHTIDSYGKGYGEVSILRGEQRCSLTALREV